MSRFVVAVLPEAEREFREAFLWYLERSAMAAEAFRTRVFEAIDGLSERADLWPADGDGIHFHVLDQFPYTLHHDLYRQCATVLAIAHQNRQPDYWKRRR